MDSKPKLIQVVLCEPKKQARIATITNSLDDPVAIICNEEGKINGLGLNRALWDEDGKVYDILAGTFLIVGLGGEDFTSLASEHQEKYRKLFEYPEVFLSVNGEILAVRFVEWD